MSDKKTVYFGQSSSKKDSDLNWCIASTDRVDYENDIVDINSLSLGRHTLEHPIPVLASHLKKLDDGTFPVIGNVVEWVKGKEGDKEVLYAGWTWADKENPDLVKKIKPLYPKLVNNFSISFIPDKDEVYRETPHLEEASPTRYKNATVTELSLVLIGAQPDAMALKELHKSLGDLLDIKEPQMEKKEIDSNSVSRKDIDELMNCYKSTGDIYTNAMQESVTKTSDLITKGFESLRKEISDRLDAIECAIASDDDDEDEDDKPEDKSKAGVNKELTSLKDALDLFSKRFAK